jgi:hypothetical protein
MLSSLWNQITANEDSSSDDEAPAPLPISKRVDEDDIAAEQLLSTFPPFGTSRKNPGEGGNHSPSSNPIEILESPSNASSVIASEWENFSPKKTIQRVAGEGGRRKNVTSGDVGGDDESVDQDTYLINMKHDDDQSVQSTGTASARERKINGKNSNMREAEKNDGFWSDEEMSIWNKNSKKSKKKKGDASNKNRKGKNCQRKRSNTVNHKRHHMKDRQSQKETSIYWNAEFRHRWVHGNPATISTPTNEKQNQSNEIKKVGESSSFTSFNDLSMITPTKPSTIKLGKQFTFSFDEAPTESSHSYHSESYDEDDESSVSNNSSMSLSPISANMDPLQPQEQNRIIKHYDEKSHWMPDQLCKHCYACEEKFTVFRRRHHCRLCGQVFCSKCSSCFVEIVESGGPKETDNAQLNEDNNNTGGKAENSTSGAIASVMNYDQNPTRTVSIRTCQMCYDQVSSSGPNGLVWYGREMGKNSGIEALRNLGFDGTKGDFDEMIKPANESISQHIAGFQGGSSKEGEFVNLAMVKEKLEMDRVKREQQEKAAADEEAMKREQENTVGIISKTISSTFTRRFGRLAESAAREAQIGDTGYNDEETKLVGTGVKKKGSYDEALDTSKGKKSNPDTTPRPPSIEHEKSDSLNDQSVVEEKVLKDASRKTGLAAAEHLEKLGRALLRSDAPILLKEKEMIGVQGEKQFDSWVNKLMMLATRCCAAVVPDVRNGDMLDIRPYCKVKGKIIVCFSPTISLILHSFSVSSFFNIAIVIPGGNLTDSAFISGIVFHKNVSHKSMTKEITNPRIMLLSGGIEYTRTENRIASLETLLEQESRYFQILVTKITKMKPDILLVGRSVSRKAQELLMETKIVLLQHVKPSLMERVARQTGATILSSTEHVMNQFGTNVLGKFISTLHLLV